MPTGDDLCSRRSINEEKVDSFLFFFLGEEEVSMR